MQTMVHTEHAQLTGVTLDFTQVCANINKTCDIGKVMNLLQIHNRRTGKEFNK